MRNFVLAIGLMVLSNGIAQACRCNFPKDGNDALSRSSSTFSGIVENIHEDKVVFTVEEIWKGTLIENVELFEDVKGSQCEVGFQEGRKYLVFARGSFKKKEFLAADICTGTRLLEDAKKYIEEIGPGKVLAEQEVPSEKGSGPTRQ